MSRTSTVVGLRGHNLVVVGAQLHALGGPRVEDGGHVDGAAGALVVTDGPVLLEGTGAIDRGGVGAGVLVELVIGTVDGDGALGGGSRALVQENDVSI